MEQTISIEKILKELYHISGFRISVYDTYFQEILCFPERTRLSLFADTGKSERSKTLRRTGYHGIS